MYHKIEQWFALLPPAVPQVQRRPKATFAKKKWTAEEDAQLTAWRSEGVPLAEIGLRLGVNRNAVMRLSATVEK
ncbi:MAG: hypothetical protein FWD75_11470 [Propionibacteriaceae bacterium]|nr:hypothetical protein [Propionibacteriaceae bacterium]